MDWMTNSFTGSWGPLALLAVSCLLLLLGILNVLSANTIIRKRYSSGAATNSSSSDVRPLRPSTVTRRGIARFGAPFLALVCMAALVTVPVTIALAQYFSRYPIYELRPVQFVGAGAKPNDYWAEYDSQSVGHLRIYTRFCDGTPKFRPDTKFLFIRYEDRGDCWSLRGDYVGFQIDPKDRR